mmetsp:Transcript_26627/g.49435  ORF Transcript_26627/g.49435 Transcript_26627/m.49435 type:complete len:102 (-) Transcript_26627:33-338(-)
MVSGVYLTAGESTSTTPEANIESAIVDVCLRVSLIDEKKEIVGLQKRRKRKRDWRLMLASEIVVLATSSKDSGHRLDGVCGLLVRKRQKRGESNEKCGGKG